jgi:hypothetical protein
MNNAIFDINYLKQRASMAGKLSRIDIYQGLVNPGNKQGLVKVQEIRPISEREFGGIFDFFENTTYGDFTAVFFPSKEIIYFSNRKPGDLANSLNGTENMQNYGIPSEEMIQAQVQKILENERLKMRLEQLENEAEENDVWGQRFGAAINMIIDRFVPGSSQAINSEPLLNGTELNNTEAALVILVENFGEEWLQKFAAKVANDPKIVPQIKAFFS